ncbi:hypothetical protein PV325_009789 [Microctonus aethiopoides]|nr:hypothetical protein PV325_009789 [Microctonus aethiopoides]
MADRCFSLEGREHLEYGGGGGGLPFGVWDVPQAWMVVVSIKLEPLGERCRGPRNDNAARRKHVYVQGVAL